MLLQPIYSSQTVLEQIQPANENSMITPQTQVVINQTMDQKMDAFDTVQRPKTAQSNDAVSKMVITS
jgi:hypothetical protein